MGRHMKEAKSSRVRGATGDFVFEAAKELVEERWGNCHHILEVNRNWAIGINFKRLNLVQYLIRSPSHE